LYKEVEEHQQGEAGGCGIRLDRASLQAPQGEVEDPERGCEWRNSRARVRGGVHG